MKDKKRKLSRYEKHGSSESKEKASLLVEAAFVLPLVFFFLISLISWFPFFSVHAELQEKMENRSAQWAALAAVAEETEIPWLGAAEAEMLSLRQTWNKKAGIQDIQLVQAKQDRESGILDTAWIIREHLAGMPGKLGTITIVQRSMRRMWCGQSLKDVNASEAGADWVYITEHGEVYHRYRNCTYLNVELQYCTMEEVQNLRNPDGSRYYACEVCHPSEKEYGVYVAVYGTRYHCTSACSSIQRLVRRVPLEQAAGRRPCSKCAGGEAG